MRIKSILLFGFIICISTFTFGQEPDSLHQSKKTQVSFEPWHTSPSLRWNATAAINFWVPAASLVFEYPLNKKFGLEVEGGPILSYNDMLFEGEKLTGFRARFGPKLYLLDKDADLFYLRLLFKYDLTKSARFETILDPSQSFLEEKLIEERFENIGAIFYAGYMVSFWDNRLVMDVSFGLGFTQWESQLNIPNGSMRIEEAGQIFNFRDRPNGAIPVISFNLQVGYLFHASRD